ncbi:MAG: DNA polymerase III subunit alpha, partial [Endomicrobium sp.]|nr:DNA polymerase III subunit alpha [Endomicrobium sp.]
KNFDINKIPLDDAKTYELLSKARSLGVFQLESDGLRDLMRRLKPEKIEEIIALIALYRPGPMGSGMLDDFVERKHGRKKIKYDHPLQEPILKETYGVILYQEQAMRMAMDLADFTAAEADGLRKAMSKKKPEEMAKQKDKFLSGAHKKSIEKKIAEKIFDNIEAFAGYGFNKSHSAAYAIVTYRTAYLKANYPLEYFTALLNSEMGKTSGKKEEEDSRLTLYLNDAKKFGITILKPNIQFSSGRFKIENGSIRFGILATKTVGERVAETIEQARKEGGQFKDWDDFLQRVDLKSINKLAMESLAKAGFFDCFGNDKAKIRAQIIKSIETSIDQAVKIKEEKDSAQGMLFGLSKDMGRQKTLLDAQALEENIMLEFEKEVLGFYLSGHPLSAMKKDLARYSDCRLNDLPKIETGESFRDAPTIRIAGMLTALNVAVSKKKEEYAKFKIEDMDGAVGAVMFPKTFVKYRNILKPNLVAVVKGKLIGSSEKPELAVDEIMSLDEAKKLVKPKKTQLYISVSTTRYDNDLAEALTEIFKKNKGDNDVFLDITDPLHGRFIIDTKYSVDCSEDFTREVEEAVGSEDIVNFK